jgi:choline-sulfatase
MNRRQFLRAMGIGAATAALPSLVSGQRAEAGRLLSAAGLGAANAAVGSMVLGGTEASSKPNLLFIFADDQTYEAVRALGCDDVHTPNLDRLVGNGVTFTHAYNQGGWHGAICVASRTMLATGAHLWHAEQREKTLAQEADAGRLWSQLLKQAGYETYMSGKWHVKIKPERIFDHVGHERPGMPKTVEKSYNRPHEGQPDAWQAWDTSIGGYWEGGKHWSEALGDDAVGFLDQAAQSDNPFFMYLAFNAPHDPRQSPKEYVDQYPLDKVKVPENFMPLYPDKDAIGCGEKLRDERLAPFPRTEYAVKVHRQEYYAIITHMDDQIGRILDALEKTGKADNTYIIFTADHGLAVGHHGLVGKQNMYDHSVRVPLMICGPSIPKDKRIATPVYLQDIMPTTLDWAGITPPESVEFKSLAPLLAGKRVRHYDAVYGAYMNLQRMVTDDHYKLIYYPKIDRKLLFNLQKDPNETENLAELPKHARRVDKLWRKLIALQKEVGDPLVLN